MYLELLGCGRVTCIFTSTLFTITTFPFRKTPELLLPRCENVNMWEYFRTKFNLTRSLLVRFRVNCFNFKKAAGAEIELYRC